MKNTNCTDDFLNALPGRVSVLGAARSGIAAARFFTDRGVPVFISDVCGEKKLAEILNRENITVQSEANGHSDQILESDLIILSPGIRSDIEILKKARNNGVPVWSEIELGYRASRAKFLAVTGSTGKSTTVSLLAEALLSAGKQAVAAGNIGLPLISVSPGLSEQAYVVAEVSSFQLETIDRFRPAVSAVLNLMKNHLDRYENENEYYEAKKNIAANQTPDDILVLNMHEFRLREWAEQIGGRVRVVWFGAENYGEECFYISGGDVVYRFNGSEGKIVALKEIKLKGEHNYLNVCAAAAIAVASGVSATDIAKGLCSFAGLSHRLEFVAEIDGVGFYNDSKATTAESVACAVGAFDGGVHLIAGGRDKGCDFQKIKSNIAGKVKNIALIGEASERIETVLKDVAPIKKFSSLTEAVEFSAANAKRGEQVVFSPGCSSFDMFNSFEHRGEIFKELVKALCGEKIA